MSFNQIFKDCSAKHHQIQHLTTTAINRNVHRSPTAVVLAIIFSLLTVLNTFTHAATRDWAPTPMTGHKHRVKDAKDRVLLEDLKTITLYRGRLTTGRRTHPIPQLTCIGGTAGCKLFTPQQVQCTHNGDLKWKCYAEGLSERVQFNHIEIICEGYEYAEDEHVLLGSCGLEFTLDYVSPHDHHEWSYFGQLDEHEREKHHERVRQRLNEQKRAGQSNDAPTLTASTNWLNTLAQTPIRELKIYIALALILSVIMISYLLRRFMLRRRLSLTARGNSRRGSEQVSKDSITTAPILRSINKKRSD